MLQVRLVCGLGYVGWGVSVVVLYRVGEDCSGWTGRLLGCVRFGVLVREIE